jgi:hypothetical protein
LRKRLMIRRNISRIRPGGEDAITCLVVAIVSCKSHANSPFLQQQKVCAPHLTKRDAQYRR